jgi:microcystin-dependent protein
MRKFGIVTLFAAALVGMFPVTAARAQVEPFLGEIRTFGYNFCPLGWTEAAGQLLAISQNTALFSLLGTQFGGNGQTTFALPDLRGRVMISAGQGLGISNYAVGEVGGTESTTLTVAQMPSHNHGVSVPDTLVDVHACKGKKCVQGLVGQNATTTQNTGGGQPHDNRPPYLAMTTCIALEGIFPSRN